MNIVILGGKEHEAKIITLGVMKAIGIGAAKTLRTATDVAEIERNWYESTLEMISAALGKSVKELEAMVGVTLDELKAARTKVLEISGLAVATSEGVDKPGEAQGTPG